MRLHARNLTLVVVAMALAGATVAPAGLLVLCVGPGGHRAVETPHADGACHAVRSHHAPADETALLAHVAGCLDSPIVIPGLPPHRLDQPAVDFELAAWLPAGILVADTAAPPAGAATPAVAATGPPSLAAMRTVILLI